MKNEFRRKHGEFDSSPKKRFSFTTSIFFFLGVITLAGFLLLFFFPGLVDQVLKGGTSFFKAKPTLHQVIIDLNGKEKELPDQGIVEVQSGDKLNLVSIDTSVFFNRGINAEIQNIQSDIGFNAPVEINKMVEATLKSSHDGQGKEFRLTFHKNGEAFGSIGIKVTLTAADWLTWGDAQKESKEKIKCYQFAKKYLLKIRK